MPDTNTVSAYEQRASYSADMARKVAGIDNRGPDGAGLLPQNPAPAPTVITEAALLAKEARLQGTPMGDVPGWPLSGPFLRRPPG